MAFTKIAQTSASIVSHPAEGIIDDVQARLLLDMQAGASRSVLLAVEGIGRVTAQDAINAALGVAKDAVNAALGFAPFA